MPYHVPSVIDLSSGIVLRTRAAACLRTTSMKSVAMSASGPCFASSCTSSRFSESAQPCEELVTWPWQIWFNCWDNDNQSGVLTLQTVFAAFSLLISSHTPSLATTKTPSVTACVSTVGSWMMYGFTGSVWPSGIVPGRGTTW
jgi:hypothetical protein